ncbi:hypothetical protein N7462_009827 [Penicillium macrosclerotiorum]|uniref:uncharacterized protein n=1 Tax=Penicillium macrosclerotiorum TaxID=303699 RepID=UPI0025487B28|nr:uncharacterized protein N7462_009827 [Penicillium macrosclerotiorum]KAJ5668757.1 hypothetical protein N7462_009827 [Penicillium macrosclerotiorum]
MPPERWNPADQRHLAGAFQDNRIIPNEGVTANQLPEAQQEQLLSLIASHFELLPDGPLSAQMDRVRESI